MDADQKSYASIKHYIEYVSDFMDVVVKDNNKEVNDIDFLSDNKVAYSISELQLLTLPNELEILGVQKYQNKNKRYRYLSH